jgi:hypothetical protein
MHRFKYTKLTREQIASKLVAAEAGPKCVSELSDVLVGKSLEIVTDNGPALSYEFKSKNILTFMENDAASAEAGYGALTLKQMVFFSHMVPKTLKGYNVFVDLDSNLVTVFEIWFCGGKDDQGQLLDNREVQRQIYFGYVEAAGEEIPKARHHTTNRIEGKGMFWRQDAGIETLEFYTSVVSTNFVELTRHADDLGYCSPSDYILVDDNLFIYDRTECEFSGIMTMYGVDLFAERQAGMRIGFNEKDELEYYMFRGAGKVVGHLARLEPFKEQGEKIILGIGSRSQSNQAGSNPKGRRTAYRPARTFPHMSEEEVHRAAERSTIAFEWDPDSPRAPMSVMSGNTPPLSDILAGREFTLRYDNNGPVWEYIVTDKKNLQWRNKGEPQWHKESYRAFEADEKLVLFAHMQSGSKPRASVKIALDLLNGLTTCILSKMGTEYYGNAVSYQTIVGSAEIAGVEAPRYVRHEFTDELVGQGFTRSWSGNTTSMHLYTTPHSASWTIYTDDQALGMQWCAPCVYVKLRNGVYLFNLVEEACDGIETCIVVNQKTLRVCGFEYQGSGYGVDLSVVGAIARYLGCYEVKHFFGPKAVSQSTLCKTCTSI